MTPVPVGGERGVDEEDLVGGRVRVDGHAGGVDGVLLGPGREELCVVHEAVLHAASERFERIFPAQVAQDACFRGRNLVEKHRVGIREDDVASVWVGERGEELVVVQDEATKVGRNVRLRGLGVIY